MDKQALVAELSRAIGEYLKEQGLELVELILRYEGRDLVLRIFADKPQGGISLDECASLNDEISRVIDEKGLIESGYLLEISSPGLDRPLKTKADFLRCISGKAQFFLNEAVGGKLEWSGLIKRADDQAVYIELNGKELEIPLGKINKAKQIII